MKHITCIEDLRQVHICAKCPGHFSTTPTAARIRSKRCAPILTICKQIKFRQRILVDVSKRDLSTTILGERSAALPLILAPIGLLGMQHPATVKSMPAAPHRLPAFRSR